MPLQIPPPSPTGEAVEIPDPPEEYRCGGCLEMHTGHPDTLLGRLELCFEAALYYLADRHRDINPHDAGQARDFCFEAANFFDRIAKGGRHG